MGFETERPTPPNFESDRKEVTKAVIEGRRFLGTFSPDNKEMAEKMAEHWGATVESFGVNLKEIDPDTKEAKDWEKEDGFSVWV